MRTVYRWEPTEVPVPTDVRTVEPADDQTLATLMERAYAGTIDEHLGGNNDGAVEIASWRLNAVPHASFITIGLTSASLVSVHDGEHWLGYVITDPQHKGRGLGTAVVAASLNALRTTVHAAVTDGNTPSERLLTNLGFRPTR